MRAYKRSRDKYINYVRRFAKLHELKPALTFSNTSDFDVYGFSVFSKTGFSASLTSKLIESKLEILKYRILKFHDATLHIYKKFKIQSEVMLNYDDKLSDYYKDTSDNKT
jgi:hypothetical protein